MPCTACCAPSASVQPPPELPTVAWINEPLPREEVAQTAS